MCGILPVSYIPMHPLETQVGQIHINNKRLSKSFLSMFSEKLPESAAEVFIILETLVLNPSANAEYEKISSLISRITKRNFKKFTETSFENAIAQINGELADMAGLGHSGLVGKMNASIAVKIEDTVFISTTGKLQAYLFRDEQLSNIADPSKNNNPLKTFENFTVGKVQALDFLIFTTPQLLNYVSMERLKRLLLDFPLETACKSMVELIRESSENTIAFGTFILELGANQEIHEQKAIKILGSLQNKSFSERAVALSGLVKKFFSHTVLLTKESKTRIPKINLHSLSPEALKKSSVKAYADIQKIRELPRIKKLFLASAILFTILLIVNIVIANKLHKKQELVAKQKAEISAIQNNINDANTAYIYNNQTQALTSLSNANTELAQIVSDQTIQNQVTTLRSEYQALINKINNIYVVTPTKLTTYTGGVIDRIILNGQTIEAINQSGDTIFPFYLANTTLGNNFSIPAPPITALTSNSGILYFESTDGNTYTDTLTTNKVTTYTSKFPPSTIGLSSYGAPVKLYAIDKTSNQIIDLSTAAKNAVQSYLKTPSDLSTALDIDVDGSVYILTQTNLERFVSGQIRSTLALPTSITASTAKLFSTNGSTNLYILDPTAKHIIVVDKTKNTIIGQYTSDQFGTLKDFIIEEPNKIAYILSDQNLFSIKLIPQ